jgi:hypothetical protein
MAERGLRFRLFSRVRRGRRPAGEPWLPEGTATVLAVGHRDYVGGMWEEIGRAQFDFLVGRGLRPEHVLLDIACGSLRGGVHFIAYLDPGHYLGIEKEGMLIRRGATKELSRRVRQEKRPEFVVSDSFEFDRFSRVPDFSLAQSLFTHLTLVDIERCLANLRAFVAPRHEFYATFKAGQNERNAAGSHAHANFRFLPDELIAVGERNRWQCHYIGDWGHPRGQVMMQFIAT